MSSTGSFSSYVVSKPATFGHEPSSIAMFVDAVYWLNSGNALSLCSSLLSVMTNRIGIFVNRSYSTTSEDDACWMFELNQERAAGKLIVSVAAESYIYDPVEWKPDSFSRGEPGTTGVVNTTEPTFVRLT
jgi:hypothetical protein